MIRIFSGFGDMGGSTIALSNLVNLFNKRGYETTMYVPFGHDWVLNQCRSEQLDGGFAKLLYNTCRQSEFVLKDFNILHRILEEDDILICHLLPLYPQNYDPATKPREFDKKKVKKVIYACHETDVYPITNINPSKFDLIQYVSEYQRDWHDYKKVANVVIPNIMSPIEKREKTIDFKKVGGVIGSITPAKRTHVAIQAALDDGCDLVLVFGSKDVLVKDYWDKQISPLMKNKKVLYLGLCDDKSLMYSDLDVVYMASLREADSNIVKECAILDIPCKHTNFLSEYADHTLDADKKITPAPILSDDEIMMKWEEVFNQ